MRPAIVVLICLAGCGPSASQVRLKRVQDTRADVSRLPGPRQAQEHAAAIHEAQGAGDYKTNPQLLQADIDYSLAMLERAIPSAGVDAPTLIAWRALLLSDLNRMQEAVTEFQRSFAMAPNKLAGRNLIILYGGANNQQAVAQTCQATIAVLTSDDDRLDLIAMCRKNMNAASNQGEMSWMSPELIAWYQAENARRIGAQIDADNARREREREENRVVRRAEQCFLGCKERGLACQNRCYGDSECDTRCVGINHACVDRCESAAKEQLGE